MKEMVEKADLIRFKPNKWALENNEETFAAKGYKGLNWKGRLKFWFILEQNNRKLSRFINKTLSQKICYIGPFYGEFGNFLLHFLPFISYLHQQGVKCHICILDRYVDFLMDNKGCPLYETLTLLDGVKLKDLPPASANHLKVEPSEFTLIKNGFFNAAQEKNAPFLDLSDTNLYWYSFRNWQLKDCQHFYDLSRGTPKMNKVVVFPRKGTGYTQNNGETPDYLKMANILAEYFEEVTLIGMPEMSESINENFNIKIKTKLGGNDIVLKECSNAALIFSQHSGAIHTGLYTNTPSIMFFKGILPIKGLDDTLRFRVNKTNCPAYLVTNELELREFCKAFINNRKK
jgi:hypothetical protein